jgi:hypothetical protein
VALQTRSEFAFELGAGTNLPPDRSMGLLLTPQATCHARSLGESLAGRNSSSSDSNEVRSSFFGNCGGAARI